MNNLSSPFYPVLATTDQILFGWIILSSDADNVASWHQVPVEWACQAQQLRACKLLAISDE